MALRMLPDGEGAGVRAAGEKGREQQKIFFLFWSVGEGAVHFFGVAWSTWSAFFLGRLEHVVCQTPN